MQPAKAPSPRVNSTPAGDACGGDTRDGARVDREPAQRRGQSQPVLSSRFQPGPRDRLQHDDRGYPGQYADPRTRPWLHGRQLPAARARQRRAVQEGTGLCRGRGFFGGRAVNVNYVSVLDAPMLSVSAGSYGWNRLFAAASPEIGRGHVLAAIELNRSEGPWTLDDDYRKVNGVVRYSQGTATEGVSVTAMFYRGEWNSTDQIPQRAIESGRSARFGHVDATNGGTTHRYSLSADGQWANTNSVTRSNVYFVDYALNLFSNFTYFLDDPVHGDQFEQVDRRTVMGGRVTHRRLARLASRPIEASIGAQLRRDDIGTIGLYLYADAVEIGRHERRQRRSDIGRPLRAGGISMEPASPHDRGSARRRVPIQGRTKGRLVGSRHRVVGVRDARACESEALGGHRPLGWHRAVRECRLRFSQQRRA